MRQWQTAAYVSIHDVCWQDAIQACKNRRRKRGRREAASLSCSVSCAFVCLCAYAVCAQVKRDVCAM